MNLSYSLKAYEEGMIDGIKEGHSNLLLKLLKKRFKYIPQKYTDLITDLGTESLTSIALNIFDIETLEDIDKIILIK